MEYSNIFNSYNDYKIFTLAAEIIGIDPEELKIYYHEQRDRFFLTGRREPLTNREEKALRKLQKLLNKISCVLLESNM